MQQGTVPLLMLSYRYNEFAANAAAEGLITIDSLNERVLDGPDRSRSPYATGQFFSVSLPVPATKSTMSVYVGPEFWLGNTAAPSTVSIDFGDGAGVQQVAMGSTLQVQLPGAAAAFQSLNGKSTDPKSAPTTPRPSANGDPLPGLIGPLVVVTNPATGLKAATKFNYTKAASIAPDLALGLVASHFWPGFTPTKGVNGPDGRASAIAWIKYAAGNTTGKVRRPLIFVEGIDFAYYRKDEPVAGFNHFIAKTGPLPLSDFETGYLGVGGYRNGSVGWNEMVDYNSDYPTLEQFPKLRERLQAKATPRDPANTGGNYDLIYLDFSDGASLIQHNAMTLVELLDWLNQPANRTADAEEAIVIGTSMGGQVTRFALAWMEQQGLCHNSKLYVSFDSPHRGANIPLGIQHMFDRLQGIWVGSGSAEDVVNNKLFREAAMQMLNFHFSYNAAPYRNAWQAWQASPGSYPSLLRKVAIANGSGQAAYPPGMSPGMQILHSDEGRFRPGGFQTRFGAGLNYAYALPGASSRGHDNVVFRYLRPFSFTRNWRYSYADPSWGAFDTAPGSLRTTAQDAQKESKGALIADASTDTFMPTISVLDVKDAGSINSPNFNYNVRDQIPDRDLPNRAKYAFDAYFTALNVNEPHTQITNGQPSTQGNGSYDTDNSSWIRNELRQSAHRLPAVMFNPYNYASPYRHLLPSVEIASGGLLLVNDINWPVDGGDLGAPKVRQPAGNFELYTSSCATVVKVNQGGVVRLGMASGAPNTASLQMSANSLLDIRAGRFDVNPGSVLRIVAGATLVVRKSAALNVQGQVIVEPGAYLCVEDPASIVLSGAGTYTVSPAALFKVNPALNLTGLACNVPAQEALTVSISSLAYTNNCTSSASNKPNYAQWTASASGGNGVYTYAWSIDATRTGTNFQPQQTGSSATFGLCLNGYTQLVLVRVVVTDTQGNRATSGDYYASPQFVPVLYPNPADNVVEVSGEATDAAATSLAPAQSQAAPLASSLPSPAGAAMQVMVYNGQGTVVFSAASVPTPTLRLNTQAWPNGLYQVTMRRGTVTTRRQLSIQH